MICNTSFIYTKWIKSKVALVVDVKYHDTLLKASNSTIFWQGFYHNWTYNHRINRLGDWLQIDANNNQLKAKLNHSAASGSGSDKLQYQSFFTFLNTTKAHFVSSTVTASIRGREATTTSKIISVKGVLPIELLKDKNGIVVLNGFDLYCKNKKDGKIVGTGNADKLLHFFIEVDDLKIIGNQFDFNLAIKFGADCDSPECLNFSLGDNEWFDYQLTVGYQLITFNNDVHVTDSNLQQYYSWKKPSKSKPTIDSNEIFIENYSFIKQTIKGNLGYNLGIPLIHKIDVNIPKGKGGLLFNRLESQHLLALDIAITDYNYMAESGIFNYNADLFFKNWKTNMHPLSFGNNGKAFINLGLKLLQINDLNAITEKKVIKGEINWHTSQFKQRQANDSSSVKSVFFKK